MKLFKIELPLPLRALSALALMMFSLSVRGAGRPAEAVDLTTPDASHVSSSVSGFKKGPGTAFNDATVNNDDNNRVLIQKTALDIVYTFDEPTCVNAYGIQNFDKASYECEKRAPKTWVLYGSDDGDAWTVLDARTSETGWTAGEYRFYQFPNSNKYLKYKIDITANNGNQYTQFARMEFFDIVIVAVTVRGNPVDLGTAVPAYGAGTVKDPEGDISFSLAGEGSCYYSEDGGTRGTFASATYKIGDGEAQTVTDASFALNPAGSIDVTWNFADISHRLTAEASVGGVVTDGATSGAAITNWVAAGDSVTLTAVPDDDANFLSWSGDVPEGAVATATELTVPSDRARNISAVFMSTNRAPVTTVWKGAVGATGDWDDPANWSAGVPQEGDSVVMTNIGNGYVVLGHSTPKLKSIFLQDGHKKPNKSYVQTIICSNWTTCVWAETITLGVGGVITHAGPYTSEETASRVWIKADTLNVTAEGAITADGVGYAGIGVNKNPGCGPFWWIGQAWCHPSVAPIYSGTYHYGQGHGKGSVRAYGDPVCPDLPGSGNMASTAHAGGAIRLEVERLTVDGTISANAAMSSNCSVGGTAGAVWITCKSVTGSGTVQANAKHCSLVTALQKANVGGAGRVAVHYDPTEQAKEESCTVRFEALASVNYNGVDIYDGTYGCEPGQKVQDLQLGGYYEEGMTIHGRGSLYFTDDTLLKAASYRKAGWRFGGELFTGSPITDLVFDEPMTFDKCQLVVREPGLKVTANAGLKVFGTGYYARREMGVVFSNATVTVNGPLTIAGSRFGVSDGTLTVNGDVVQTNAVFGKVASPYLGGELVAHAGPTNTPSGYGAEVTVNGNWTLGAGGVVHVTCEPLNGAITKITANGNLSIAEGARVDSDMGGYRYGPGATRAYNPGPSHGGRGSGDPKGTSIKATYGDEREPVTPGSGGGKLYGVEYGGAYTHGGGVVLLEVAKTLTLNGLISADANRKWAANLLTPGSGGSVNIRAFRLYGNGTISASGGVSDGYGPNTATEGDLKNGLAAGGGGRIAVRVNPYGCGWTDAMKTNNAYAKPGPRRASSDYKTVFPDEPIWDAEPGTVWWGKWGLGTMILVR